MVEPQARSLIAQVTPDQRDALIQLSEIADGSGGTFVVEAHRTLEKGSVEVDLLLDCEVFNAQHREGGLRFNAREGVRLVLPENYPVQPPRLYVTHSRFAGFENVVRGGICLFRSPDTEWDPATSMAQFVADRIWGWFERAARNETARQGGIFHSPVVHHLDFSGAIVFYEADEPTVSGDRPHWGFTRWRHRGDVEAAVGVKLPRFGLDGWFETTQTGFRHRFFGAALLTPQRIGFMMPETLYDLAESLAQLGIERNQFYLHLARAARSGAIGAPLLITLGTPMQSGSRISHYLATLLVDPQTSELLWHTGGHRERGRYLAHVEEAVRQSPLRYCWPMEERSGVVTRRDDQAPMAWFRGRTVSVWGCGALGAPIAIQVVRAGVRKVILRDNGYVSPGLLARQPYDVAEVGMPKVLALQKKLLRINPDLQVLPIPEDVRIARFGESGWTEGADLVVNATASAPVATHIDKLSSGEGGLKVPVLSVGVDDRAEAGMARWLPQHTPVGLGHATRETKLALCRDEELSFFADAFFPVASPNIPFYPEPGCSDSTFRGSSSDMVALASAMLNWGAVQLFEIKDQDDAVRAMVMVQPHAVGTHHMPTAVSFACGTPTCLPDARGTFQVFLRPGVKQRIQEIIRERKASKGPRCETGGPLYGEWDAARQIVWVDDAGAPPPDSIEEPARFRCGTDGLEEEVAERMERTRESCGFIGTWHTHPQTAPEPSGRDLASMRDFFARPEVLPSVFLMMIVGAPHAAPELRPHVFRRSEFVTTDLAVALQRDG